MIVYYRLGCLEDSVHKKGVMVSIGMQLHSQQAEKNANNPCDIVYDISEESILIFKLLV